MILHSDRSYFQSHWSSPDTSSAKGRLLEERENMLRSLDMALGTSRIEAAVWESRILERGLRSSSFPSPRELLRSYPSNDVDQCAYAHYECGIKLSIALQRNGVDISTSSRFRATHVHRDETVIHQPSAFALASWLKLPEQLGEPTIFEKSGSTDKWYFGSFREKEGIAYFAHDDQGGNGFGHIDVISGGELGIQFHPNRLIWFWEFKNGSFQR